MKRKRSFLRISAFMMALLFVMEAGLCVYATDGEGGGTIEGGAGGTTGSNAAVGDWVPMTDGIHTDPATGNFVYETVDKLKTSQTYYHTEGFTIAAATVDENGNVVEIPGGGEIKVYLDDRNFVDYDTTAKPGSVTTNKWTLKYDAILEAVKTQYPAWYQQLTADTGTVALKLDPVLSLHINGKLLEGDGGKRVEVDKYNLAEYIAKYPWLAAYADKKFNRSVIKRLAEADVSPEDIDKIIDEHEDNRIGKFNPDYYTFNYNPKGQFSLGDAIPTSEDVRNGYQADGWYGWAYVHHKTASKSFTFWGKVRWKWTYTYDYDDYDDLDEYGNPTKKWDSVTVYEDQNYSYTVNRTVAYWYLSSPNFYDLDSVVDYNGAFPGGSHTFESLYEINMTCVVNGVNLLTSSSYDETPNDNVHVDWGAADKSPNGNKEYNTNVYDSLADAQAAFRAYAEGMIDANDDIYVTNDTLIIGDNTFMNGERRKYNGGKDAQEKGDIYAWNDAADYKTERQDTEGRTERIPSTIKNKEYPTTITVYYRKKIRPGETYSETKSGKGAILPESTPIAIAGEYRSFESQEPIRVHTPVVAPVVIQVDNGTGDYNTLDITTVPEYKKTQLVDGSITGYGDAYNEDADYQLLLDGKYRLKFDKLLHGEHVGYADAADNDNLNTEIYNKYTKRRFACFPFVVQVDGQIYYPDDEEGIATDDHPAKEAGYTEWIEVYHDDEDGTDLDTVDFYIPTWATEGYAYKLQYMVVPENATKEDFDAYRQQYLLNDSPPVNRDGGEIYNYMATYVMEVQLSGHIYDFQVVGINEKDIYDGYTVTYDGNVQASGISDGTQNFAFCPSYQEKKQGKRNRIGGNSVRYSFDGMITNDWLDANTLPLCAGSSLKYKKSGVLRRGDTFAFTVRTIANLWDEEGDEMYIVPTFRYVSYDGNITDDDITVYYTKVTETDAMEFVKYGSEQDLSYFDKTNIADTKFKGSFYTEDFSLSRTLHALQEDDAEFSKDTANELLYALKYPDNHAWPHQVYKTKQIYLSKKVPCTTLSAIKLTPELRLLTGNVEQLEQNLGLSGQSNLTYVKTKDEYGTEYNITSTSEPEIWDEFRKSMQTWFGTYYVPNALYVTSKDVDLWEYASNKGYITGREDIFYDDGYLVINFKIFTKNNGNWHLAYYGTSAGKDQWQVQGPKPTAKVGNDTVGNEIDIPVRSGDVGIIDMGQSKMDDYDVGSYITN